MNKRNFMVAGGAAVLGLALIALPGHSARSQNPDDSAVARIQQQAQELQERLQERQKYQMDQATQLAAMQADIATLAQEQSMKRLLDDPGDEDENVKVFLGDDGASWLGVETHEVTADKAKELKLPAEHGAVLGKIIPDSPAAKAGLKENDVVTEINGQRVEGTAQFRRMIREIPAGRTVQLTVWRDGRTQTISATLGKAEQRFNTRFRSGGTPGVFTYRLPGTSDMPQVIPMPDMDWSGDFFPKGQPRLGIDAEDLSGQFGSYFGAPDGEGVLVREVNSGSPAEKAGLKAGDVITSLDGNRIRSVGDLREKLSAKRDNKDRTVKLGVLRNKGEISLSVELPEPATKGKRVISHRTNI